MIGLTAASALGALVAAVAAVVTVGGRLRAPGLSVTHGGG